VITLWRISRHRDLSGGGGLRAPGRWHERGLPIVYLAESPAAALLETCVHTSANDVPPLYTLLEIAMPSSIESINLDVTLLPRDWPQQIAVTRTLGSEWLRSNRSAMARVPSAIVPATYNVLLNPRHREAKRARIVSVSECPFDTGIKK
jgi:RES domain-containing protein